MTVHDQFRAALDYLDLGMHTEANAALEEIDADLHMSGRWMWLRERALEGIGDVEDLAVIRLLIAGLPDGS